MQHKQLTVMDQWLLRAIIIVTCVYGFLLIKGVVQLVANLTMSAWWDAASAFAWIAVLLVVTTSITAVLLYAAVKSQP